MSDGPSYAEVKAAKAEAAASREALRRYRALTRFVWEDLRNYRRLCLEGLAGALPGALAAAVAANPSHFAKIDCDGVGLVVVTTPAMTIHLQSDDELEDRCEAGMDE